MEVLNCLVSKHCNRLRPKTVRTLSFNIHMVLIGLKPSFLIDTLDVQKNLPQLNKVLKEINIRNPVSSNEILHILLIKDDYFLVNLKEMLKRVEKLRYYVDVSNSIQLPVMIDHSSVSCLPWMRKFVITTWPFKLNSAYIT